MVATAERPIVHRRETVREANLRIELDTLRWEVELDCALIVSDLDRLIPAVMEVGPPALHWLGSASTRANRLRLRVGR